MASDYAAMAVANTWADQQCFAGARRHTYQHGSIARRTTEGAHGTGRCAKQSEPGSSSKRTLEPRSTCRALQDTCLPYDGAACPASCNNAICCSRSRKRLPQIRSSHIELHTEYVRAAHQYRTPARAGSTTSGTAHGRRTTCACTGFWRCRTTQMQEM